MIDFEKFVIIKVIDVFFVIDVLFSNKFVLVDFWVIWCGFCKMVVFVFEEIVIECVIDFIVVKFDVDINLEIVCNF